MLVSRKVILLTATISGNRDDSSITGVIIFDSPKMLGKIKPGKCLTPTLLLICSSFSRENGHLLLICSSLSTSQKQKTYPKWWFYTLNKQTLYDINPGEKSFKYDHTFASTLNLLKWVIYVISKNHCFIHYEILGVNGMHDVTPFHSTKRLR